MTAHPILGASTRLATPNLFDDIDQTAYMGDELLDPTNPYPPSSLSSPNSPSDIPAEPENSSHFVSEQRLRLPVGPWLALPPPTKYVESSPKQIPNNTEDLPTDSGDTPSSATFGSSCFRRQEPPGTGPYSSPQPFCESPREGPKENCCSRNPSPTSNEYCPPQFRPLIPENHYRTEEPVLIPRMRSHLDPRDFLRRSDKCEVWQTDYVEDEHHFVDGTQRIRRIARTTGARPFNESSKSTLACMMDSSEVIWRWVSLILCIAFIAIPAYQFYQDVQLKLTAKTHARIIKVAEYQQRWELNHCDKNPVDLMDKCNELNRGRKALVGDVGFIESLFAVLGGSMNGLIEEFTWHQAICLLLVAIGATLSFKLVLDLTRLVRRPLWKDSSIDPPHPQLGQTRVR